MNLSPSSPSQAAHSEADSRAIAIRVEGLQHAYGDHEVLKGVSFDIPRGQVVGYLGPNGAGKTTTVKTLTGALRPTAGKIELAGIDVVERSVEARRHLGHVPEAGGLYESLTPQEFLAFVGSVHGIEKDALDHRIASLLEILGLEKHRHEPMQGFSKGMKQKTVLASGLIHDPTVVILDEPLSGLDAHATLLFKEIIVQMAARGKTVFYCSHLLDVVERVCDRVLILHDGRLVADGSPEALRKEEHRSSLESVFRHLTAEVDYAEMASRVLDTMSPNTTSPKPSAP